VAQNWSYNHFDPEGAAVYVGDGANLTDANAVFLNTYTNTWDIAVSPLGVASVTYSCMSSSGWGTGTQTLTSSPFTETQFGQMSYRLSMTSSCINAGSNAAVPPDVFDLDHDGNTTEPIPLDLAGRTRFVGNVDVGAYEKQ
jgi:hypothetical protein